MESARANGIFRQNLRGTGQGQGPEWVTVYYV